MFKNFSTSKSTSNLRTYGPGIIILLKQKQETNAFCIKKKKMFHVKRFVWNNRKSSDIIEPAIDVYKINLKTVARKLKLYRKIQMKTNWKEYSYGKSNSNCKSEGRRGKDNHSHQSFRPPLQ